MSAWGRVGAVGPRARVLVLALCVVSAQLGTSAVNVALPELAGWSGGRFGDAQWAVVAYVLAMTGASLAVGHLGDVMGRARLLQLGIAVFLLAGVACALAPSLWVLVGARAVQGLGAAAMAALPLAIARDSVPAERAGSAMGLLGTASAVGTAAGPALGGMLLGLWGWEAIFWAMLPLPLLVGGAAVVVFRSTEGTRRLPRENGAREGRRGDVRGFDLAGSLIVALAAASYATAFTAPAGDPGWTLGWMIVAGALVVVLVPIERRTADPLLPAALVRNTTVGIGAVLNLVVGTVMMSTLVVGPFYLSGAIGLDPMAVGAAMAAGPVVSIVFGVLSGRLVDRGAPERLLTVALLTMTVAAALLAFLPPIFGLPGYLAGTMLLAPGYQLFLAANSTHVMNAVAGGRRGTASGILGLSRNFGLVTGTSAMASLFAVAVGTADISAAPAEALDAGLRLVFGVALCLLVAASVVSGAPLRRSRS